MRVKWKPTLVKGVFNNPVADLIYVSLFFFLDSISVTLLSRVFYLKLPQIHDHKKISDDGFGGKMYLSPLFPDAS